MTESLTVRPERLIALLLLVAADLMFWAALLGAALVLRGDDVAAFEGHASEAADSLYTWLLLPAVIAGGVLLVPALIRPRDRALRILAAAGGLFPVVALMLTLFIWSHPAAQLVELEVGGRVERFAVEVKPTVDPTGRDGRFASVAPDHWHPGLPIPDIGAQELGVAVLTEGRILAQVSNAPGRHPFFAIAWIWAIALGLHWLGATLVVAAWGSRPGLIWVAWCALLTGLGSWAVMAG